jgi:hypothetical protein
MEYIIAIYSESNNISFLYACIGDLVVFWNLLYNEIREQTYLMNAVGIRLPNQAPYSAAQGRGSQPSTGCLQGTGWLCLSKYYKYEPSPRYCQPPRSTFPPGSSLTHSNLAMPSQLRNRTYVANTEPTSSSAASSATLEYAEPATDRPMLRKRSEMRRPKRGFSRLSGEVACKVHLLRIGTTELICIGLVKYDL